MDLSKEIQKIEEESRQKGLLSPEFERKVNMDRQDHWNPADEEHWDDLENAPNNGFFEPKKSPEEVENLQKRYKKAKKRRKEREFCRLEMEDFEYNVVYGGNYLITMTGKFMKILDAPGGKLVREIIPYIEKRTGHLCVSIRLDGKRVTVKLYKLVAESFIPNPLGYRSVLFSDGDRTNIHPDNLFWGKRALIRRSFKRSCQVLKNGSKEDILLLHKEGLSRKEIAEETGVKYSTVSSLLYRESLKEKAEQPKT